MILAFRIAISLLLIFGLTELPPWFRVFGIWVATLGFLFMAVRATLHRLHLYAIIWLLCTGLVQPIWRLPYGDAAWHWVVLGVSTWSFLSVAFEETAADKAARQAKSEGPQPKQRRPDKQADV